jgi:hypothetical protein
LPGPAVDDRCHLSVGRIEAAEAGVLGGCPLFADHQGATPVEGHAVGNVGVGLDDRFPVAADQEAVTVQAQSLDGDLRAAAGHGARPGHGGEVEGVLVGHVEGAFVGVRPGHELEPRRFSDNRRKRRRVSVEVTASLLHAGTVRRGGEVLRGPFPAPAKPEEEEVVFLAHRP